MATTAKKRTKQTVTTPSAATDAALGALRSIGDGDLADVLARCFKQMEWAEDEIAKAQRRHPAKSDLIWSQFMLVQGTHDLMATEFVYRSHAHELLERVARGEDPRPATDAEIACMLSEVSLQAPLPPKALTVYMRLFNCAFPEKMDFGDDMVHHEAIYGNEADDFERELRRKLAKSDRVLLPIKPRNGRVK